MEASARTSLLATIGLMCSAVAIAAGYMAWDDMCYALWGRTTVGRVTDMQAVNSLHPEDGYYIWYAFSDKVHARPLQASAAIDPDGRVFFPRGKQIEVEYIPGDFVKSRLRQTGSRLWPVVFGVFSAAMLACLIIGFATRQDETPGDEEEETTEEEEFDEDLL